MDAPDAAEAAGGRRTTRAEVAALLSSWRSGAIDAAAIKTRLASAKAPVGDPVLDEVLAELDLLEVYLLTPEDVPALLAAIDAGDDAGLARWYAHRDAIDLDQRSRTLKKNPFYKPFCR